MSRGTYGGSDLIWSIGSGLRGRGYLSWYLKGKEGCPGINGEESRGPAMQRLDCGLLHRSGL